MTHKSHNEVTANREPRIAVFPGSFNPFTIGHADIVRRGLKLFDRIDICIGVNLQKPDKNIGERADFIREVYSDIDRVSVSVWSGLMAEHCHEIGARFILRGVRSVKDFEYERDMADANRIELGIETCVLYADPELAYISSSLVRELQAFGRDVNHLLPTRQQYIDFKANKL